MTSSSVFSGARVTLYLFFCVVFRWPLLECVLFCCNWGARVVQWVRSLDPRTHTSLSPILRGFAPGIVNDKKGCTRLAAASDKVYQLLAHGRWFSPGIPASSTTKTGRHDIAEILLKVALKHQRFCFHFPLNFTSQMFCFHSPLKSYLPKVLLSFSIKILPSKSFVFLFH
jgi:hypothetical protein